MDSHLPIEQIKARFEQEIQQQHLVIESPTGSGKSTLLPIWCRNFGRVLVIEPRRIACRALARFVAETISTPCGDKVGFATRFQQQFTPESEVVFVTPGIALAWFAENRLADFELVILDEFHERRWDTDLLAALIRQHDQHRIIITSATVEGERLARFLGGIRLQSAGRSYPVSTRHLSQSDTHSPSLNELANRVEQAVNQALAVHTDGDILVFLPGKGEINACIDLLKRRPDLQALPLHAGIEPEQQDLALKPGLSRRVILATNVAETSLTIPGIRIVIDSGLERRTHHRNGRTVLGLHPISRASADQRAGRAGRLGPGHCLRLWGKQCPLEAFTPPQVLREELTELVMATASAGTSTEDLTFPDPLPVHAVERATARLEQMGAIDPSHTLTPHGKRLAPLPLDPLFAHLVTAMPDDETRCAMVDLVASISAGQSPLRQPTQEAQIKILQEWAPEACDATTRIQLIRKPAPSELQINRERLQEAKRIAKEIRNKLSLPTIEQTATLPMEMMLKATITAAPELLFIRREKRRHAMGNGHDEVEVSRDSRFADKQEIAVVFDQHTLPGKGRKQTLSFATCLAPVSKSTLISSNLCSKAICNPTWEDGQILITLKHQYAGRTIQQVEQRPEGEAARQAAAQLILEGRIFPNLASRLTTDIDAWNLYTQLNGKERVTVEPLPWLSNKLKELGVERAGDLDLIEPDDLGFDGIPSWEREAFDSKFPRTLQLENMATVVHYEPTKRRITVERVGGKRKTQPRPIELPAWPGWRVYFKDASRVIQVK